VGFEPTDSSV